MSDLQAFDNSGLQAFIASGLQARAGGGANIWVHDATDGTLLFLTLWGTYSLLSASECIFAASDANGFYVVRQYFDGSWQSRLRRYLNDYSIAWTVNISGLVAGLIDCDGLAIVSLSPNITAYDSDGNVAWNKLAYSNGVAGVGGYSYWKGPTATQITRLDSAGNISWQTTAGTIWGGDAITGQAAPTAVSGSYVYTIETVTILVYPYGSVVCLLRRDVSTGILDPEFGNAWGSSVLFMDGNEAYSCTTTTPYVVLAGAVVDMTVPPLIPIHPSVIYAVNFGPAPGGYRWSKTDTAYNGYPIFGLGSSSIFAGNPPLACVRTDGTELWRYTGTVADNNARSLSVQSITGAERVILCGRYPGA